MKKRPTARRSIFTANRDRHTPDGHGGHQAARPIEKSKCISSYGKMTPFSPRSTMPDLISALKPSALPVTAYQWQWEYVNAHYTRDAAEAFIKRKSHDYRHGLRIYVESQYHAWEFNAIKSGILSGKIRLVADE